MHNQLNDSIQKERQLLLAGLLHDIGKVGQRAEDPPSQELKNKRKYDSMDLAPTRKNKEPYLTHVWWTAWWIEENENLYKEQLGVYGEGGDSLFRISARHHRDWKELSSLERIIVLADRISAGIERGGIMGGEEEEEAAENKKTSKNQENPAIRGIRIPGHSHKHVPLLSLWAALHAQPAEDITICNPVSEEYWAYNVTPLSSSGEPLFPDKKQKSFQNLVEEYKKVWKDFQNEHKSLIKGMDFSESEESFRAYVDTLLALLHKYFWSVPSGTYNESEPIISLYDHLKTTGAFAHCLYRWMKEVQNGKFLDWIGGRTTRPAPPRNPDDALKYLADKQPFLLVGGDLQGIQKFIYNIHSSKARSALKGRSFFLQLLTEVIIEKILRHPQIRAYRTHVLFSAGGKFYLILPNTPQVKKALKELHQNLQEWLWKSLHGDLYVGLAWVPFGFYTDPQHPFQRIVRLNEKDQELLKSLKEEMGEHPYRKCEKYAEVKKNDFWERYVNEKKCATLGDLWWVLAERLQEQKYQRWWEFLKKEKEKEKFLKPDDPGGPIHTGASEDMNTRVVCQVTGRTGKKEDMERLDPEDDTYVEKYVWQQIQLGKALGRNAQYLLLRKENTSQTPSPIIGCEGEGEGRQETVRKENTSQTSSPIISIWGWNVYVLGEKLELIESIGSTKRQHTCSLMKGDVLWRLNDPQQFLAPLTNKNGNKIEPVSLGFTFYGGVHQPWKDLGDRDKSEPATFAEIAGILKSENGEQVRFSVPENLPEKEFSSIVKYFETQFWGLLGVHSQIEWLKKPKEYCDRTETPFPISAKDGTGERDWFIPCQIQDPRKKGTPLPFETTYLAVLRADVDRLGELFVFGLPPNRQSFSALSTLSWMLNAFFAGFINRLHASTELFRHHLQIVYSGGDDLFVVGRWDAVLAFALLVRHWFWRFVACRTDISLSAGFRLFRVKYPIQRAAESTQKAENTAKQFQHGTWDQVKGKGKKRKEKDAICIGDIAIGWSPRQAHPELLEQNELEFVLGLTGWMLYLLSKGMLSTGFLQRLVQYEEEVRADSDPDKIPSSYSIHNGKNLRWLWHFVYQVGRIRPRTPEKIEEQMFQKLLDFLNQIYWTGYHNNVMDARPERMPFLVGTAVRLALLFWRELRKDIFYSKVLSQAQKAGKSSAHATISQSAPSRG